jgi:hypothetical protein
MKEPCIDMECAAGADACLLRSAENTFAIVICGIAVLFLLATAVFGLLIAARICRKGKCARNVANMTLAFTTGASVVQLTWVLSDLMKFVRWKPTSSITVIQLASLCSW